MSCDNNHILKIFHKKRLEDNTPLYIYILQFIFKYQNYQYDKKDRDPLKNSSVSSSLFTNDSNYRRHISLATFSFSCLGNLSSNSSGGIRMYTVPLGWKHWFKKGQNTRQDLVFLSKIDRLGESDGKGIYTIDCWLSDLKQWFIVNNNPINE